MKRVSLFVIAAALTWSCTQTSVSNRASVLGPVDLVLVDILDGDSLAVLPGVAADGTEIPRVGYHGGQLFVTSTDSNELRVFEPYREGLVNFADWARAPNPLETLSIPVLDQPQILVADEGLYVDGRATGAYVYAARRAGAEISVVSTRTRRQVGGRPVPLPAGLMAVGAWMNVVGTTLPETTQLFVATWDGAVARVIVTSLPTNEETLATAIAGGSVLFSELTSVAGEPIKALQVVPPRPGRTLDGAAFCDTAICLAVATRRPDGTGRSILLDPASGVSAPLSFGAQMRDFAISHRLDGDLRLYGIIDEEPCGGAACGGVLSVELTTGTSVGGFLRSTDVTGLPMEPLRAGDGLVTGLSIGAAASLHGRVESIVDGGVSAALANVGYTELGAFSSSNGALSFFNAQQGLLLDANPARVTVEYAQLRRPEVTGDGGVLFARPDAGPVGTLDALAVNAPDRVVGDYTEPWREVTVPVTGFGEWKLTMFDGYLPSQLLYAVINGNLPGLTNLADTGGTQLSVSVGAEAVASVGDVVRFFDGIDDQVLGECGRARVASLQPGVVEIDEAPTGCARDGNSRFTVKAAGTKSIVLVADLEGYLGRVAPGETFVYRRRLTVLPPNVGRVTDVENRTYAPGEALTLVVPESVPSEEGAYIAFSIVGNVAPYRAFLDPFTATTQSSACSLQITPGQIIMGNIAMGVTPRSVGNSTAASFQWATFAVLPSGNAMVQLPHPTVLPTTNGVTTGVVCRQ